MPMRAEADPDATLARRVRRQALNAPGRIALRFESDALSYGELDAQAAGLAAGLAQAGVKRGEPVCVLLETSCDYVAVWLALSRLGAMEVPINTGFRGDALAHALRLTGARVLILDASLAPAASRRCRTPPTSDRSTSAVTPAGSRLRRVARWMGSHSSRCGRRRLRRRWMPGRASRR